MLEKNRALNILVLFLFSASVFEIKTIHFALPLDACYDTTRISVLGGVNAFVPSMSLSALQRLDSPIRSASAETWTSVPVQSRSRTAASRRAQGAGISGVLSGGRFCERQGSTDALKAQMTDEEMAVDQASCV